MDRTNLVLGFPVLIEPIVEISVCSKYSYYILFSLEEMLLEYQITPLLASLFEIAAEVTLHLRGRS